MAELYRSTGCRCRVGDRLEVAIAANRRHAAHAACHAAASTTLGLPRLPRSPAAGLLLLLLPRTALRNATLLGLPTVLQALLVAHAWTGRTARFACAWSLVAAAVVEPRLLPAGRLHPRL